MRHFLDKLYFGSGLLAAFFLFMIGFLVMAQVFGRLFGRWDRQRQKKFADQADLAMLVQARLLIIKTFTLAI